jgi:hypothetical protein
MRRHYRGECATRAVVVSGRRPRVRERDRRFRRVAVVGPLGCSKRCLDVADRRQRPRLGQVKPLFKPCRPLLLRPEAAPWPARMTSGSTVVLGHGISPSQVMFLGAGCRTMNA